MKTLVCTDETPFVRESLVMPEVLSVSGTVKIGPLPPQGGRLGLLCLARQRGHANRLPKHWLLIEVIVRNGRLRIASHGFGAKREGHAAPIEPGLELKEGESFDFRFDYSGKTVEMEVAGQSGDFTTELSAPVDEPLFLFIGCRHGIVGLNPPIGWEITYGIGDEAKEE